MAIKKKDHEKLDDDSIERVIAILECDKPVTIKRACEELNIAANGPRLTKIIAEYKDRKAEEKKRRAANRGKPATDYERTVIVESYLLGDSLKEIGDRLYRSTAFVKAVVDEVGVPQRQAGETYWNFSPLPDQCVAESFEAGKFVWASRYGTIAEIVKQVNEVDGVRVYQIYVMESPREIEGPRYAHYVDTGWGFYAIQNAYELGSLEHLEKYGVNLKRVIG